MANRTEAPPPLVDSPRKAWLTLYSHLFRKPNVIGCFVGIKTIQHSPTGEPAVVCCVSKKLSRLPERDRIPRQVLWPQRRRRRPEIMTDVVQTGVRFHPYGTAPSSIMPPAVLMKAVMGPGDRVSVGDGGTASVGVVIQHPVLGRVLTTAGHLVPGDLAPEGKPVLVASGQVRIPGRLLSSVATPALDYGLVRPDQNAFADNLYADELYGGRDRILGVYAPRPLRTWAPSYLY